MMSDEAAGLLRAYAELLEATADEAKTWLPTVMRIFRKNG